LGNIASITRANFLPLTIVIVLAGLAASFYSHRAFNRTDAVLVLGGALLTHASVNAFNVYFDYRSKIDEGTIKTPFSGGVDTLVKGQMEPSAGFAVAFVCLIGAALIGSYFLSRLFSALLPLVVYGALVIVLYTPVLARVHALSEIVAGSGFGLMGVGVYVTQAGKIDATAIAIFFPVTILVALLLFLNEFPDAEVDRVGGRRHIVILLGKRRSAWLYVAGLAATYLSILAAVSVGAAPIWVLISLVTIPLAYKASRITLKRYDRSSELVPALGTNVVVILSTILLMAGGFAIASFV
jgi:1,4-dihydroxy-2-naphthoate octaprenyltransferase